LNKLIKVEPKENFNLYVKYSDGVSGEIPCVDMLKKDEYSGIREWDSFKEVRIDSETNDITWQNNVSICKNAVYKIIQLKNMLKNFDIDEASI